MTPEQVFERIIEESPGFRDVRDQHLRDNGNLLPHLLMSDLLRFIASHLGGKESLGVAPPSHQEVRAMLSVLDAALSSGNEETGNAIAVSFLENIESEPFFTKLEPLLGPALRAEHLRQVEWYRNAR